MLNSEELIDSEEYFNRLVSMGWPQEFHEKLRLGNLKSNVGIATLWTFQEVVYRDLDPESYSLVGNYYDKQNALEPFVRNCLANPNIRYVIIVGNDKAGSKEVLVKFFEYGIVEGKVFGTDTKISPTIPIEDINELRRNVQLIDVTEKITRLDDSKQYADVINEIISGLEKKGPYADPRLYEKAVLDVDNFPADRVGFIVRGKTVGETWLKMLNEIFSYGAITKMKINDTTQVRVSTNLTAVVDGEDPDVPIMQPYFRFDEVYLKSYYDEICSDKIPAGTLYTYGSRLRAWQGKDEGKEGVEKIDQINDIIQYLKKDPLRTSAVAVTWIVEHELTRRYLNKDKNSPCIALIQASAPEGKLHLTAFIRSNDMFRAWPLNAFGLRKLQKIIAEGLGLEMGSLTTVSGSAHIYQDNWQDTKDILAKYFKNTNCFWDPRGYYTIQLKGGKIVASHYSPDSQLLKVYEGKKAREINDAINSSQHPIDSYHSSYLGEELMKAEIALSLGIEYVQDSPLKFGDVETSACAVDGSEVKVGEAC